MSSELDTLPVIATRRDEAQGWLQSIVSKGVGWGRKYSLFQYPFVTACCGMEYMSLQMARYDLDRFGAAAPRFTPRQADLLMVAKQSHLRLSANGGRRFRCLPPLFPRTLNPPPALSS